MGTGGGQKTLACAGKLFQILAAFFGKRSISADMHAFNGLFDIIHFPIYTGRYIKSNHHLHPFYSYMANASLANTCL